MNDRNLVSNAVKIACVTLAIAGPVMAAEFKKGLEAFNAKDYEAALAEWMPLAKNGDLNAMYNIALMYDEGLGVPAVLLRNDIGHDTAGGAEDVHRGILSLRSQIAAQHDMPVHN